MAAIPLALEDGLRPQNEQLLQRIVSVTIYLYMNIANCIYEVVLRNFMRKPSFPSARKIYKVRMYGISRYRAGTARIYACGDSRLRGR